MIDLTLNLVTGRAAPAQQPVIKAGADVPVRITLSAEPGAAITFQLALFGADVTSPGVLAFLDEDGFSATSSTVYEGVIDANDARLIAFMTGKSGPQPLNAELVFTRSGQRRVAPNVGVTCQQRVIDGPEETEGGPTYLTEAQSDARYARSATAPATADDLSMFDDAAPTTDRYAMDATYFYVITAGSSTWTRIARAAW